MFLNRVDELTSLKERFDNHNPELSVFYGRRRVGKSELIDQFIKSRSGIRILAREETKELQLKQVSSDLTRFFGDTHLASLIFPDWDAVFTYLHSHQEKRVVIALDEFPYLVREDPSLFCNSVSLGYMDQRLTVLSHTMRVIDRYDGRYDPEI